MPAGMQIFDGIGNVTLDVSDSVAKYLGSVAVAASDGSTLTGTVTDNGLLSGAVWWLATVPPTTTFEVKVSVSISGNTLTWATEPSCPAFILYYGVF